MLPDECCQMNAARCRSVGGGVRDLHISPSALRTRSVARKICMTKVESAIERMSPNQKTPSVCNAIICRRQKALISAKYAFVLANNFTADVNCIDLSVACTRRRVLPTTRLSSHLDCLATGMQAPVTAVLTCRYGEHRSIRTIRAGCRVAK